jgi:hypothetical protein
VPSTSAICDAIRRRRLLTFEYQDRPRLVAPYCHGWSSGGKELLRGIQVGGESASGVLGAGKLWHVVQMRDARATSRSFTPDDPDYAPDDAAMARIHCRVWLPRIVAADPLARTK